MRKLVLFSIISVVAFCFAASAYAGMLKPGQKTTCINAKSITFEASGTSSKGDRGNANAVVWLSSSAITVPISLGPSDDNRSMVGTDKGKTGLARRGSMGAKKVVLRGQNNFSRGDSIGDISGEVRITNTGTINMNITCG